MTDDNLNQLKRNYDDLVAKKQKLLKLRQTIEKYERKKAVKKYLELKEEFLSLNRSIADTPDDVLFEIAMGKSKVTGDSDNIYVFLGSYKKLNERDIVHSSRDIRIFDGETDNIDYKIYRNLEVDHLDKVIVPSDECEEFEEENIIIYPRTILTGGYYYQIRSRYYKDAIKNGIDKAREKLLSREKTNYNIKKYGKSL